MKRSIFIVMPAPVPTGPIKGGYALANALVDHRDVTVVTLKPGAGANAPLDARVREVSLAQGESIDAKVAAFRELLRAHGGRAGAASISLCLSADWVNAKSRADAITCASVRANLLRNYYGDYGIPGIPVAVGHLVGLRMFDHVVAMSEAMARQIRRYSGVRSRIIGNFVDEAALEPHRVREPPSTVDGAASLRLLFLGSLTRRKQPLLLLHALRELRSGGIDVALDVVGDGPLRTDFERETRRLELAAHVRQHGFLTDPYPLLARADALVLPSLSEGAARACLEALHLGVPCVVREVDGSAELIRPGVNGELFTRDGELAGAIGRVVARPREPGVRHSLLPDGNRQQACAQAFLDLVESGS